MPVVARRAPATALIIALLATAGAGSCASTSSVTQPAGSAVVERVIDGDTIVVRVAGRSERVRLIGIDTPETKKPNSPVQCYGPQASAFTASLLPKGTAVGLTRDAEARDDYDRLLAYVNRTSDGLFVNLAIVAGGYAHVLTIPPNVAHAGEFVAAARQAREQGRGLWSSCR